MPAPDRPVAALADARMGAAALAYATRFGWHVFPLYETKPNGAGHVCVCPKAAACGSPGKHPRTARGLLEASADAKQIARWWRAHPRANIGIACGPSKLVVVDVDPRNGGDDTLRDLEQQHGALPVTVQALTGGGGVHHVFRRPDGDRVRGGVLAQGVDLKADGGYIVVAPSNHASGQVYTWELAHRPGEVEPAILPAWIAAKLDTRKASGINRTVTAGFLGAAFAAAGWLGRTIAPDRAAVRCPWEDEHTSGTRYDSSTVIFGPTAGAVTGAFFCSHSHCSSRGVADVIAALPATAKAAARVALKLPDTWLPKSAPATPPDQPPRDDSDEADADGWQHQLVTRDDGKLSTAPINAVLLLANSDEWRGVWVYDAFADAVICDRPPPVVVGATPPHHGDKLADAHTLYVQGWFAKNRGVNFALGSVAAALDLAAKSHPRHPLRDYLSSLRHDGQPRMADWLCTYLGAPPTPYVGVIGNWWLVSAVARAFRHGCQVDHTLVLEGPQGAGKSSALRILAGDWFLSSLPDVQNKDAAAALAGHWIVEIGELDAIKGVASTRVKNFLTLTRDVFRPAYARFVIERERSCVFAGTTNEHEYLHDATGGRRFWPVHCGTFDLDALARDRDQLWAEAVAAYEAGAPWWPQGADSHAALAVEQEQRYAADAWEQVIATWLDERADQTAPVTLPQILADPLHIETGRWTRADQMRASSALRRLGYQRHRARAPGERPWLWTKA